MAKIEKKSCKYINDRLLKLQDIEASINTVESISITIEWTKSRTWGNNPKAEALVHYTNPNHSKRYQSESISGCGYDKESTATAQVLNQIRPLLKEMYAAKEAAQTNQRDCLGYGSGYCILPSFEGGVGFDCHRIILEKLGYIYDHPASGKTFDVYTFRK